MIEVVPPCAAATVPVSKSSLAVVPPNGSSMWVWQSMPPGMTYLPLASSVCSGVPNAARCAGSVSATIFDPSIHTSATKVSLAVTTVPSLISVFISVLHQRPVRVRAAIAEELPGPADLLDHVHVEGAHHQLVLVLAGRAADDLAARIDEVRRPVELADVPRRLGADAVDRADEVAVGDRVRGLLELPQVLREARDRRRRVVDDLGAGEPERARTLGEVAVVADVRADRRVAGLEHRVAEVARLEEVLLPEPAGLRDVGLAVLAEVRAVGIDDRGGVVVDAGLLALVDRDDHHHLVLRGERRELL